MDINEQRIAAWNDSDLSKLPVYEPGLDSVVGRARGHNLSFSSSVDEAIAAADIVLFPLTPRPRPKAWGLDRPVICVGLRRAPGKWPKLQQVTRSLWKKALSVRTAQAIKEILAAAQGEGLDGRSLGALQS